MLKKISFIFFLILAVSCATSIELSTYVVKEKSRVVDKSIQSLDWNNKTKVNVVKVKRDGKEIIKISPQFKFVAGDTVYILNKSNEIKYVNNFFD